VSADECEFEVMQGGATVAKGCGSHDSAVSEATHYAMVYGQDGPVSWTVHRITRNASGRKRRELLLRGSLAGVSVTLGAPCPSSPGAPEPDKTNGTGETK
jgi:hypothetical protein